MLDSLFKKVFSNTFRPPTRVFCCEIYEIFLEQRFFYRTPPLVAASERTFIGQPIHKIIYHQFF